MASDGPLLSIGNLSISYQTDRGRQDVLRGINLDMARGRIVGIVGESGSGKSTLALALLGLLPDNARIMSGEIRLAGIDLLRLDGRALREMRGRQLSMIFQDPMTALHPALTVGSQMVDIQYRSAELGRRQKRERAARMLEKVGIADAMARLDSYPDAFSGGMRQRIAIAMALMGSPDLLVADEPTTALDVTTEAQIVALLRQLRAEVSGSIMLISHNLGLVGELCDDVVIMYAGEIVERGTVFDIFDRPRHPYTQALLACDPARIGGRAQRLPTIGGEVPDLGAVPAGCIFAARCGKAFDLCHAALPLLTPIGKNHAAACHLVHHAQAA